MVPHNPISNARVVISMTAAVKAPRVLESFERQRQWIEEFSLRDILHLLRRKDPDLVRSEDIIYPTRALSVTLDLLTGDRPRTYPIASILHLNIMHTVVQKLAGADREDRRSLRSSSKRLHPRLKLSSHNHNECDSDADLE